MRLRCAIACGIYAEFINVDQRLVYGNVWNMREGAIKLKLVFLAPVKLKKKKNGDRVAARKRDRVMYDLIMHGVPLDVPREPDVSR